MHFVNEIASGVRAYRNTRTLYASASVRGAGEWKPNTREKIFVQYSAETNEDVCGRSELFKGDKKVIKNRLVSFKMIARCTVAGEQSTSFRRIIRGENV